MAATLNCANLVIGTNRTNVETNKNTAQYYWIGQDASQNKHTLECVFTLDEPVTSITVSFSCKYRLMQVFNNYYFTCTASDCPIDTFPLTSGERFTLTANTTKTLTVKLLGNYPAGNLYLYFGIHSGVESQNQVNVRPDTVAVACTNTNESVSVQTVAVSNIYRYSSDFNPSYDWAKVSVYGNFGCYGVSSSTIYNATCIPLAGVDCNCKATSLVMRWIGYHTQARKYRWALCTSMANKVRYQDTTGEVDDDTQIASGTFDDSGTGKTIEITLNLNGVTIQANIQLYLFIWAYQSGSVAPHILRDWDITAAIYYSKGGYINLYNGSAWGKYSVYIFNETWSEYSPYVYDGANWIKYGG